MLHEKREVNVQIPHEPSSFLKRVRESYVIPTTADEKREVNVKIPHKSSSFLKRVRDSYVIPTTAGILREEIRSKRKNTT